MSQTLTGSCDNELDNAENNAMAGGPVVDSCPGCSLGAYKLLLQDRRSAESTVPTTTDSTEARKVYIRETHKQAERTVKPRGAVIIAYVSYG